MEFHAIKRIRLLNDGQFFDVPSTKSEIFNSKFLNLEEKQKLLNYIYSTIKIVNSEVDVNATIDFGKDIEVDNKYIDIVRSNVLIICRVFKASSYGVLQLPEFHS